MKNMTAMVDAIVARQKRRNVIFERQLEARVREAQQFISSIPDALLRIDPVLRRLLLFGSLAAGRVTRFDFDIDLAVDSDRYLRIVDWSLQQPWRIDVVDLSAIDTSFAREIQKNARVPYEAER